MLIFGFFQFNPHPKTPHHQPPNAATVKAAQTVICEKIRLATGARLFEPEPEKKGNSNTGANLKLITQYAEKTAQILDCSEELLVLLHELLGMIESINAQDADVMETLSKRKILASFFNCPHPFTELWLTPPSLPDTIKTKVSPSVSCQKLRKRQSMLRQRKTSPALALEVPIKSKI